MQSSLSDKNSRKDKQCSEKKCHSYTLSEKGNRDEYCYHRIDIEKHTHFIRSAKTILHSTYDAVVVMAFAFEVENGIDDVFEDLWTSDRTFLGDVADQKNWNAAVLREDEKLVRDFPHLRN